MKMVGKGEGKEREREGKTEEGREGERKTHEESEGFAADQIKFHTRGSGSLSSVVGWGSQGSPRSCYSCFT